MILHDKLRLTFVWLFKMHSDFNRYFLSCLFYYVNKHNSKLNLLRQWGLLWNVYIFDDFVLTQTLVLLFFSFFCRFIFAMARSSVLCLNPKKILNHQRNWLILSKVFCLNHWKMKNNLHHLKGSVAFSAC